MLNLKCYGLILALMAAAELSLGVADVTLTALLYCGNWKANYCSKTGDPYFWTWVASAIWGSVPIFITGLYAICMADNAVRWRFLTLGLILSHFVFSPAILILTIIELIKGSSSKWNFYTYSGGSLAEGNINSNEWNAKFGIDVTIAVVAGILWIITGWVVWCSCCNSQGGKVVEEVSAPIMAPAPAPVVVASRPAAPVVVPGPPLGAPCTTCPGGPNVPCAGRMIYVNAAPSGARVIYNP